MAKSVEKVVEDIQHLPDSDKLKVLAALLEDLDKPDPEIDRVWAEEARKRWKAHKAGRLAATPYETVVAKHRGS